MISLKLDVNEVNLVLGALGQLPYVQTVALIEKVKAQAQEQVNQEQKAETVEE